MPDPAPEPPGATAPVAVVTAAADGIGRATALAFGQAGYRVVAVDVDEAGARTTVAELVALPGTPPAEVAVADVTDEAAVASLAAAVRERTGTVAALVNVVGGSRPGLTAVQLPLDEWNRLLALNLTSTFLMCRAFIPLLEANRGGTIVNVSSGAGIDGMRANPAYCAAKAGVIALTRALAIDHMAAGVRVNCVAPGPIRTPLMQRNRTPEEITAMGRGVLAGRIGEPDEIAQTILWLSSPRSSYVVGQTIEVDGGRGAPV
ncbi:MAG TPA: SDR family NAD(P)-dependent oxidoreductase [Acidimicrobiia bacterium]|nr:SDR family NAD(P)-dependent oxidoreductase [Acidimicrobiia bacterium]